MQSQKNLRSVGIIHKAHSLKGALKVSFEAFFIPYLSQVSHFYLLQNALPLPYFVEEICPLGAHYLLKFQDIDAREQAFALHGAEIYVDITQFKGLEKLLEQFDTGQLIGFEVFDEETNELIGVVDDILHYPAQELMQVLVDGKELLININEETLVAIDVETKKCWVALPEGYLETFLS
ncbi:MAG: ribosome maturation factor RimM [Chitinophagales bacterium]|nr:16S rRNA processing protein RimM [Bacteroidota bacterium]MCB9043252.1 16S rRNA processing protein RimM [Chitinophagales bacterium]